MNKKGQALVEFILVLPVFIILFLAVIDFSRIISIKSSLETKVDDVILNETIDDNITVLKEENGNEITYTLKENINLYSPILVGILKDPYEITIKRVVYEK